jgi:hypothetical protein
MKNRLLPWITLLVLSISLGACRAAETQTAVPEPIIDQAEQQNETAETAIDQAYPLETAETPIKQEMAYPISEDDIQLLFKAWALTEFYIDGASQENKEIIMEFNSDNTFQIITPESTVSGNWIARLFAAESNLILNQTDGSMVTYQIVELEPDSLILSSIQDGKPIEEHFTPANW